MTNIGSRIRRLSKNGRSNEFIVDDFWDSRSLTASKESPLEPIKLHNITKHPEGRISLTKEGRKHCGAKFDLPTRIKELFIWQLVILITLILLMIYLDLRGFLFLVLYANLPLTVVISYMGMPL